MAYTKGDLANLLLSDHANADALNEAVSKKFAEIPDAAHVVKGKSSQFNFFNGARKGWKLEVPSGQKPEEWFKWLEQNFGLNSTSGVEGLSVGTEKNALNSFELKSALQEQAAGGLDKARLSELEKIYKDQASHLQSVEKTLAEAKTMARSAAKEIFPKITEEIKGLSASFNAVRGKKFADINALKTALGTAGGANGITGLGSKVVENAKTKEFVAQLVNFETGKIEEIVLGKAGEAVNVNEVMTTLSEHQRQLLQAPQQYVDQLTAGITQVESKLAESKALVDEVGSKVLKKSGSAFAVAAEKAGTQVAATVGTEVNKIEGAISKAAERAGVVGEAAMAEKGFFAKMMANAKANFNIKEVTKTGNELGVIERGPLGKGMVAAGAGAGAILVGYGLKDLGKAVGFVSPDTDEQGREVPADSGTLVKSVAELGAGAALAYFTLLKGGKAAGIAKV